MIEAINVAASAGVGSIGTTPDRPAASGTEGSGDLANGSSFADSLGKLLESTNGADSAANSAIGRMLDGSGDVHEAMIALQQADMMLQLTVQVRNKLVQAYQDIMRMPV
jgi:flagellar hook-basal body complex protein FliE